MSMNLNRKGVALVSGLVLAVSSLVGVAAPANAAGEVTLKPTTGTGTAAFTTDPFSLTTSLATTVQAATVANTPLAFKIDNPDQHQLLITSGNLSAGTVIGITKTGAEVALGTFTGSGMIIDFTESNLASVVLHSLSDVAATNTISVKLDAEAGVTDLKDATGGAAPLEYGARSSDANISIQSWVEVSAIADYTTVDASYASDVVDVTFVDPKNVSVISEVVRSKANGTPDTLLTAARVAVTTNEEDLTDDAFDDGSTFNGVQLSTGDRVLVLGQNDVTENGIYTVTASAGLTASLAAADIADLTSDVTSTGISVTEGTDGSGLYRLSGEATVNFSAVPNSSVFYTHLNEVGNKYLTANVRFSRADINLNQVDLEEWKYGVVSSQADDGFPLETIDLRDGLTTWDKTDKNVEIVTPVGHSASNFGTYGNILIRGAVAGDELTADKTYQVRFAHDSANAPTFQSPAFTTVSNNVDTDAVKITSAVTSTTDATTGSTPSLRAGTNAFTYRAQAKETNATTDAKTANIPVVAVVQAGAFMPTGESIAVTGSTKTITRSNEAVIVAGLTDKDGRFSVTVTSTTAAAAQSYTVEFFIGDGGNQGSFAANEATIEATYVAASPNSIKMNPEIASSSTVNLTVSVLDQFTQAISANSKGALNVELKAPDDTKLEQFAAVVDGEASFTFENYLSAGSSDVLSVRVFNGTSTSPDYITALDNVVSLFGPVAVEAINVAPEVTGVVVEYVDFIEGKSTTGAPGPTGGTTYSGTVVNSNGAGIAGAGVTIAADGFQFKDGNDNFYMDSVTLATDAAGSFSVTYWTQIASATGQDITVTSGDATATTKVKSELPGTLSTKNLVFTWDLPATVVTNTTYAVTATVADKHGNGVPSASVKFSGFGAAQFNGLAETTRTTDRSGQVTAFLRSLKDVDGPSAIGAELLGTGLTFTAGEGLADVHTDDAKTAFDESQWSNTIENRINFLASAPASSTQKVNAGSFKGYVAVYALGYEGQRLSAKIGNNWVIVDPIVNNQSATLARIVQFIGLPGVDIQVRIYIDRVLVDTIPLTTIM